MSGADAANDHQQFRQRSQPQQQIVGKINATPRTRTRTRSRLRRSIWDWITSGRMRVNTIDDNYAKYGKRNVKKKARFIRRLASIGAIGIVLFALVFARKHFTKEGLSPAHRPRPILRRGSHTARDEIPPKIYPKSIVLESWDVHMVSHRSFPYATKSYDRRRNIDPDYGDLDFNPLRKEEIVAHLDDIAPGGFDPNSIEPTQDLKARNRRRRGTPGEYPAYRADGREIFHEDASYLDLEKYYDDDSISIHAKGNDPNVEEPRPCQTPEFEHYYFPTCNDFHERDLGRSFDDPEKVLHPRPENEVNIAYLASGFYRDTWIFEDSPWIWPSRYPAEKLNKLSQKKYGVSNEERTSEMIAKSYRSAVLKTPRMTHDIGPGFLDEVWTEAIIMERLTKSPRIINIYGHCSSSTMVEVVPIEFEEAVVFDEGFLNHEVVEKRNRDGLRPYNNFTSTEKLHFALEMAESLADLHGYSEGIIVHDDVQMCQWLRTPDGHLKLGDFNRATIMSWNLLEGEYCKFNNGEGFSQYRAPEEYAARNLNEKIDIFSFGNNIYAMMTGLWNWYDEEDDDVIQKKLIDGKLPFVDPRYKNRSFAEKKLVELMEKCWIYNPDERISSFEAVEFLRDAVKDNKEKGYE
ncbi:hypothetical protein ACHAW5_007805 [Stephanodiscus triporus]|uniref:Protein kinase domain-containing protein n=1 Tax=Stephanodiscus triporus TaxID=2934178 RepID=A0ABD3MEL1_9STRA